MAEPYNYNVVSPLAGFAQGLQISTVLEEQRKAREVEQRAREGEAALLAAFEGGTPTTTQISDLILKNPSIADRAKQAYTMRTASQREADERQRTELYMLMRGGEPDAVKAKMQTFIDAARNSGRTQEAAQGEANLRVYEQNPNAGMISIGATLAATNPELWSKLSTVADQTPFLKELIAEGLKPGTPEFQKALRTKREGDDFIIVPGVGVFAKKIVMAASQDAEISPSIPQEAVDLLKTNPKLRSAFDSKYGSGAAARVLEAQ
jgi:hypothetical protein